MFCPLLLMAQDPPKEQPKPEPVKTSVTVTEKIATETPPAFLYWTTRNWSKVRGQI